jgi:hypothetical protein
MKPATKNRSEPFICDVQATFLKRSTKLSRSARMLYMAMRALANGKTGELAIRGNPLDWRYISKQAEIGRNVWQRCLKELIAAGYVTREREIVEHYKDGRKRMVWGRARYFAHRQPKTAKKPIILPMPLSCTVEEKGTQISSEAPYTIERFGVAVESEREKPIEGKQQSSSPSKDDDGSRVSSLDSEANPFLPDEDQTLVRNVQARLRAQYPQTYDRNKDRVDDPLFIREAISMIDERGESAISVPAAYFASGIAKILDCEAHLLALSDVLARKEHRRTKFMPGFSPALDAAQEKARQQFNRMVEGKIQ